MAKTKASFLNALKNCKTEEDVKSTYATHFTITYDTANRLDLYTKQVLFEFKFDKNLGNIKSRAQTIAQSLYYVRRLKYGSYIDKPVPNTICIGAKAFSILTKTKLWENFVDNHTDYDWDLAPSIPDTKLVDDIANFNETKNLHVYELTNPSELKEFEEQLANELSNQLTIDFNVKKVITEYNFEEVFNYWNKIFGDAVRNGFKTSRYFVSDIQENNTIFLKEQSKALFRIGSTGEIMEKKILTKDYEHFWGLYEKVSNPNTIQAILAKIDRLSDETMRRFHGEFFTPVKFAKKALDYIEHSIEPNWWKTGNYRLWDMAAGTGNLEYYLPQEALKYCYLSTLYIEDVEHLKKLFHEANIFQYDYLNDDVANVFQDKSQLNFDLNWKLPKKLLSDLANPEIKWIILINPPFATAQKGGTTGGNKASVSETNIRTVMHRNQLGEVSRELFAQFIFRINHEFKGKKAFLGLFSTLKYLISNNDQKLRDNYYPLCGLT